MIDPEVPATTAADLAAEIATLRRQLAEQTAEISALRETLNPPVKSVPPLVPDDFARSPMGRRRWLGRAGAGLVVGALSAAPLASSADAPALQATPGQAAADPPPVSTSAITYFYQTFSGYSFKPIASDMAYAFSGNGSVYWTGGNSYGYFAVPLLLPQAARVTNLVFSFYDQDQNAEMGFSLTGYNPFNPGGFQSFVSLSSSGYSSFNQQVSDVGTPAAPLVVIDNSTYQYFLTCSMFSGNTNHKLWGARLAYVNNVGRFNAAR